MTGQRFGLQVLLAALCVMGLTELTDSAKKNGKFVDTLDYFLEEHEYRNATAITWAHAVNSRRRLEAELKGHKDMLEADILMGTVGHDSELVPIMAHPPANTSDLTFAEFLKKVIHAHRGSKRKFGIKLDFKDIESVEPSLKILKSEKHINFPVWLNADVLPGPGNSSSTPVDAKEFLNATMKYAPWATLSLGWTTSYDCNEPGEYERQHIKAMEELLDEFEVRSAVTFPVRAGLAIGSYEVLLNLLASVRHSTLTVWSAKEDALNVTLLQEFISQVGYNRVYVDVPFSLAEGPKRSCNDTEVEDEHDDVESPHHAMKDKHPAVNHQQNTTTDSQHDSADHQHDSDDYAHHADEHQHDSTDHQHDHPEHQHNDVEDYDIKPESGENDNGTEPQPSPKVNSSTLPRCSYVAIFAIALCLIWRQLH